MTDVQTGNKESQGIDPVTLKPIGSEESPEASGKAITISGKSYNVSDDVAQAFDGLTKSIDRRFDERSAELGGLRQFKNEALAREQAQARVTQVAKKPAEDMGTLMYEDPDKYYATIEKNIENRVSASEKKMEQRYQQAEKSKKDEIAFWDNMWAENKDLALIKEQSSDVIRMIGKKYEHLNLQDTPEVRTALAQESRDWMKNIRSNGTDESEDGFVEGSSTQGIPARTKQERPRMTTKQILESRREAKRNAMATRS